jgi:hypothetical protein
MTALVRYEAARSALAAAHSLDEVKDIRDKSEAMAAYARQANDTELIAWATEIKVRAERKAGAMLLVSEKNKGARGVGKSAVTSCDRTPTLEEIGVTKNQSSRWQRMAAMPDDQFEVVVETSKAQVGQVTSAVILREAKKLVEKDKPAAKPAAKASPAPAQAAAPADDDRGDDILKQHEEVLAENLQLQALVDAIQADDPKAEALKWRRAADAANRTASEKMDAVVRMDRDLQWYARQLDRCGKAVGQTDRSKIAAAVEAFVRQHARAAA